MTTEYAKLRQFTDKLLKNFKDDLKKCQPNLKDYQNSFLLTNACHAYSTLESILILLDKEKEEDAKALLRRMLEMLILTKSAVAEPDFAIRFIFGNELKRRYRLDNIMPTPQTKIEIEVVKEAINKNNITSPITDPDWYVLADKHGLKKYFEYNNFQLSESVHVSGAALASYFHLDANKMPIGLIVNPAPVDPHEYLYRACVILLDVYQVISSFFKLNNEATIKAMADELASLTPP